MVRVRSEGLGVVMADAFLVKPLLVLTDNYLLLRRDYENRI